MFRVVAFTASPRCCVHIHADQRNEPRWDVANARMPQEVHDASFSSSSRVYTPLGLGLFEYSFWQALRSCVPVNSEVLRQMLAWCALVLVMCADDVWLTCPSNLSLSLSRPVLSFCLFASFPPVKHVPNAYFFVWTRCLFTSRVANWSSLNCQNKSNQNDFYSHE